MPKFQISNTIFWAIFKQYAKLVCHFLQFRWFCKTAHLTSLIKTWYHIMLPYVSASLEIRHTQQSTLFPVEQIANPNPRKTTWKRTRRTITKEGATWPMRLGTRQKPNLDPHQLLGQYQFLIPETDFPKRRKSRTRL